MSYYDNAPVTTNHPEASELPTTAAKAKPVAKTLVTLDVKPWDTLHDETDMTTLETSVRGIEQDGLVWGQSQLQAVGFGIRQLCINLVVEDATVSFEDLREEIEGLEDYVQSSDVAAMQKI